MSLFDFVETIGQALFDINGDDNAAEKIRNHIETDNPGIEQLNISYQEGFVTLHGRSHSWLAVEKAILMAGNIKGVTKVTSEIVVTDAKDHAPAELSTHGAAAAGHQVRYYIIAEGDTLSAIAQRVYDNPNLDGQIFEANREVIGHPDHIFPGQKILIP